MGYTTKFNGELRFTKELSASQLATLDAMLGEDCRDHPEWGANDLYYIDLELTKDFGGLKWNGTEKTYGLEKLVNVVIAQMRKKWPDFGLTGTLMAQGEDFDDVWALNIGADGLAHKEKLTIAGQVVTCPKCEAKFRLDAAAAPDNSQAS
jgi:hypothetical protein